MDALATQLLSALVAGAAVALESKTSDLICQAYEGLKSELIEWWKKGERREDLALDESTVAQLVNHPDTNSVALEKMENIVSEFPDQKPSSELIQQLEHFKQLMESTPEIQNIYNQTAEKIVNINDARGAVFNF